MHSEDFSQALESGSLEMMQRVPKSDLHSHAGRGGSQAYIGQQLGINITPPSQPFENLGEMNTWLRQNVNQHFPDKSGYLPRVQAAFAQAAQDHLQVLALSFAVDEFQHVGNIQTFADYMEALHQKWNPQSIFLPDLAIGYALSEMDALDEILDSGFFKGLDISNYMGVFSMEQLKVICRKAKTHGLTLKAHVGEFGGPDEVMRYAEELELDQIQHGVTAAKSPQIMNWLAEHRIQLNVCPTSNVMLKVCESYAKHPIRQLFDHGVPVTINSDDLLIFNASVSREYLNLYQSGTMTENELDEIRKRGLGVF